MAISSFSLFESAKKGLSANQIALTVVSQNVANASTEGYTRQEVLFKNSSPSTYANNITDAIGTGVDVGEIRQIRDTYIEAQLRLQNDTNSYWSASKSYLERIQTFLTDNSDAGIRGLMDKFWKAAEDVSNSAQSQTNRLSIIQAGEAFTSGIKYVAAQIDEVKNSADGAIGEKISQLNDLAKRVAEINAQIAKFERADLKMNDLRDERARLINDMSKLASIGVSRSGSLDDGVVTLNGHAIVDGGKYDQIETAQDSGGNTILKWKSDVSAVSSNPAVADASILSGAADAVYNINVKSLAESYTVFSKAYDLDKSTLLAGLGVKSGKVSVNGSEITVDASKTTVAGLIDLINKSDAGVKAELDSGGKVTLRSIDTGAASKISFDDKESNLFEKLGLLSAVTSKPEPAITSADASLNIGGSFTVNGVRISITQGQTDSLNRIASEINGAAGDVEARVNRASDGSYSLKLTARDGVSKIELGDASDNLLYRLGLLKSPQTALNVAKVSFSGGKDAVFSVNNTEYSRASNEIKDALAGIELRLNSTGLAQIKSKPVLKGGEIGALLAVRDEAVPGYLEQIAGFVKTFAGAFNEIHKQGFDLSGATGRNFFNAMNFSEGDSARKIIDSFSVNSELKSDPSKFAAAGLDEDYYAQTGVMRAKGPADNTVALKYTEMKSTAIFEDGSSVTDKYSEIVFRIGSQVQTAQTTAKTQEAILNNLKLKKESVSGVSIDEEISNMMKFQHAYNASARMINVIDGILNTIINGLVK